MHASIALRAKKFEENRIEFSKCLKINMKKS